MVSEFANAANLIVDAGQRVKKKTPQRVLRRIVGARGFEPPTP